MLWPIAIGADGRRGGNTCGMYIIFSMYLHRDEWRKTFVFNAFYFYAGRNQLYSKQLIYYIGTTYMILS